MCKKQFNAWNNKHFCDKCRLIYGNHISRKYKLLQRKFPNKQCVFCQKKFISNIYWQKLCNTCKIIPNINQKLWLKRNPEKALQVQREYRKRNLELCRKRTRENQIKLNNKKRFGGLRFETLERDKYICQKCGKDISGKNTACIHHKNEDKTDNRIDNLISYCKSCHPSYHYNLHKYQYPSGKKHPKWKDGRWYYKHHKSSSVDTS